MSTARFLQITDTHLFNHAEGTLYDVNTAQSLTAVVTHILRRETHIDGILATGDLCHDSGTPAYRRLRQLLKPLNVPIYCLPGNHDDMGLFACALKGINMQIGSSLLRDDWQLLFMDSAVPGAVHGHLRQSELERLEAALREQPTRHALICLHHNPVSIGSAWLDKSMLDNAASLFDITDRYPQVRALLWGHVHQAFDILRNQAHLLACPSTCVQFKPNCDDFTLDDLPPGYRWLELHSDGRIETGVEHLHA